MNRQPFFILLICFGMGIGVQDSFLFEENIIYLLLFLSIFLVGIVVFSKSEKFFSYKPIFLGTFFFILGVLSYFLHSKPPLLPVFSGKERLVFQLNKKLNSSEKNKRYEVEASLFPIAKEENSWFKMVLSVPKEEKELDFQHYYIADAYVNTLKLSQDNFRFDYQKYLARKQIFAHGIVSEKVLTAKKQHLKLPEIIKQKRLSVLQKIDSSSLKPKNREFLKGIILADRTEMDTQTIQDFSKTGLVHILAISGSHMAIIFWMILFLLKPVFPVKWRKIPLLVSIACIWLFAVFIDYGSSVVRSCIMITAYYIMVFLQRKPDFLHAMALAGWVILLYDTQQLFDVGFQLSFLAVLGIYWLNPAVSKYFPKYKKSPVKRFFMNVFSVSVAAQIATLPLVIYYFHQFSGLSVVVNFLVIPLAEVVIIFSFFITILLGLGWDFQLALTVYDFFATCFLNIVHRFSETDFMFFQRISLNVWELIILFVFIYFLRFTLLKFELKNKLRLMYVLLIFCIIKLSFNFYHWQKTEILVHDYYESKLISIKEKGKVLFLTNSETPKEKTEKFIVEPYLTFRRIDDFEIKKLPKTTKTLRIQGNIYKIE
jgi:competence protein ComEC